MERNNYGRLGLIQLILGALVTVGSGQAHAQVILGGKSRTLTDLQVTVANGSIFAELAATRPDLADCTQAHVSAYVRKTSKPASERYDAARRYEECVSTLGALVVAEEGSEAARAALVVQDFQKQASDQAEEIGGEAKFMGLTFGVGVGVSFSGDKVISEAEIAVDGTVRAIKDETQEPRVILESHYYGWCHMESCYAGSFGVGPFFGIVAKTDELLSAFGAGIMFGWKDTKKGQSDGFSVGIGAILDSDVKSLADGFDEGKAPPAGETQVKFETKSRWAALLFFTRTF